MDSRRLRARRAFLVVSGTLGRPAAPAIHRALVGVQVGYVFSCAAGVPFNPVTGTDRNNDTTVNDRPPAAGRNSVRQPATSSFDLRASRSFASGRQRHDPRRDP